MPRLKIIFGYLLLLAILLFSLFFVRREMENQARFDHQDVAWADSLLALLRAKDANTLQLLRTLSRINEEQLSTEEVEHLFATQDSVFTQQRVQHRVITHRDTVMTPPRKKSFLKRLGEVFVPSKQDTAIEVKTSREYAVDTLLEVYNPTDSLQERLRDVVRQKQMENRTVRRRKQRLQRLDNELTARIDSLLKSYEEETLERTRGEALRQQEIRRQSARTIGSIAAGALLLAVCFLIVIGRDIARNNRYRRQLEEARSRAEELLKAREQLMLAITHDFKAPLSSIMGYADLLSCQATDEQQRSCLDNLKNSSEHLLRLVTDLLDFHRLDLHKAELHRVGFHPSQLLDEVRLCFEPLAAAKGIALHCEVDAALAGRYISDPLRLRQILNNLLSNAIKFTEQGSVTLTARYADHRLTLSVADTGKGMQLADCRRIFQAFTRLPGAQGKEGFGLGLSIVHKLVQLLEGTIDVESQPGKGSTFTVCLPLYPVADRKSEGKEEEGRKTVKTTSATNASEAGQPPQPSAPSLKRLLLIDDDRIQLQLTAAMLKQGGLDSVACSQVDELLDALRTGRFDLLLTDVQMPAMDGFSLLELLRASNIPQARTLPVLAVTARSDMRREEFTSHGFAGCLYKPFTLGELLREVERIGLLPAAACDVPAPASPATAPAFDLSALTAFSADDPEASAAILQSFVAETRQNAERLRQAIDARDADAASAVAHKMLPVFTMIGAEELCGYLRRLEALRGHSFSEEAAGWGASALAGVGEVMAQSTTSCLRSSSSGLS